MPQASSAAAAPPVKTPGLDSDLAVGSPTHGSRTQLRVSGSSVEAEPRRPSRELPGSAEERGGASREARVRGSAGPATGPRADSGGHSRIRSSLGRVLSGMKQRGPQSLQAMPASGQTTPVAREAP